MLSILLTPLVLIADCPPVTVPGILIPEMTSLTWIITFFFVFLPPSIILGALKEMNGNLAAPLGRSVVFVFLLFALIGALFGTVANVVPFQLDVVLGLVFVIKTWRSWGGKS